MFVLVTNEKRSSAHLSKCHFWTFSFLPSWKTLENYAREAKIFHFPLKHAWKWHTLSHLRDFLSFLEIFYYTKFERSKTESEVWRNRLPEAGWICCWKFSASIMKRKREKHISIMKTNFHSLLYFPFINVTIYCLFAAMCHENFHPTSTAITVSPSQRKGGGEKNISITEMK